MKALKPRTAPHYNCRYFIYVYHFVLPFPLLAHLHNIQVLVEQFEDDTAPADQRLKYYYDLAYPSVWEIKVLT